MHSAPGVHKSQFQFIWQLFANYLTARRMHTKFLNELKFKKLKDDY